MSSDTTKCPTCGTTTITFDPPIAIEAQEACGEVKPGLYANATTMPRCLLIKGHEGQHMDIVEAQTMWS